MIFYFSATGNSEWVARQLSERLDDSLVCVNNIARNNFSNTTFELDSDERIGFVFPIHSWGPPAIFMKFIEKLNLKNYNEHNAYAVCTCGDDTGFADYHLKKALKKKDIELCSFHSVTMPNTYILLPGFDVDPSNVEKRKKEDAIAKIQKIADCIESEMQDKKLLHRGSFARIKSMLIYPPFTKQANGKCKFTYTDKCTGCGICQMVCPSRNIEMKDGHPEWHNNCTQCLACIHRCPNRAIEHGKITLKKGRYYYK